MTSPAVHRRTHRAKADTVGARDSEQRGGTSIKEQTGKATDKLVAR